ncbi:MAG: ribonuclease P protein component [Gammaproteobacteria bacterium]|nr:ribonuclease P protein component [Gammaproteobacteria bacterium]
MIGTSATSNYKFGRSHRLLTANDFDAVFSKAQRSADRFYTLLYTRCEAQTSRLGFAIAKKKVSLAPGRNRLKRIARESFRQNRESLTSAPEAFNIVILANKSAATATNEELFASLDGHWRKLRNVSSGMPTK